MTTAKSVPLRPNVPLVNPSTSLRKVFALNVLKDAVSVKMRPSALLVLTVSGTMKVLAKLAMLFALLARMLTPAFPARLTTVLLANQVLPAQSVTHTGGWKMVSVKNAKMDALSVTTRKLARHAKMVSS